MNPSTPVSRLFDVVVMRHHRKEKISRTNFWITKEAFNKNAFRWDAFPLQ